MFRYFFFFFIMMTAMLMVSRTNWVMVGDREIPRFRWVAGSGEDVEWSVDNIYLKKDQKNGFREDYSTKSKTIDWETDQVEDGRDIEKINSEEQKRFANDYKPNNKGFASKEKNEKE